MADFIAKVDPSVCPTLIINDYVFHLTSEEDGENGRIFELKFPDANPKDKSNRFQWYLMYLGRRFALTFLKVEGSAKHFDIDNFFPSESDVKLDANQGAKSEHNSDKLHRVVLDEKHMAIGIVLGEWTLAQYYPLTKTLYGNYQD